MHELTPSQKARTSIRFFKTIADSLALRGFYKPGGRSGQTLADALKMISPEIYGSMNDPRIVELKGLEYVLERLPQGLEACTRITLTAQDDFENTSFKKISAIKRRRVTYRIDTKEYCMVITRGVSEIYDILTHLTFLSIEAQKIKTRIKTPTGGFTREWRMLESVCTGEKKLTAPHLDQALWNLSSILGRTYQETYTTYHHLLKQDPHINNFFQIIYNMGSRALAEDENEEKSLVIYFTPSLRDMLGHHEYARQWSFSIKTNLQTLNLLKRPIHIFSANLHSIINTLYGYGSDPEFAQDHACNDIYKLFSKLFTHNEHINKFARQHGFHELPDQSGANINCQLIDTAELKQVTLHPALQIDIDPQNPPVILVMDYAFGAQAFEVMDELLRPFHHDQKTIKLNIKSISVMGKAGILSGKKGDIMLAAAHVVEGTAHNYIVDNDLRAEDFKKEQESSQVDIYTGPLVTVLGTSLQNRDLLERFQASSWKAVGLEMEGGHYQRAINAAIIRSHINPDVKVRYAYYASDNPLISGQTLSSGSMGAEGIRPTYMVTKVILEKILKI